MQPPHDKDAVSAKDNLKKDQPIQSVKKLPQAQSFEEFAMNSAPNYMSIQRRNNQSIKELPKTLNSADDNNLQLQNSLAGTNGKDEKAALKLVDHKTKGMDSKDF